MTQEPRGTTPTPAPARKHSGCLTAFLALAVVGNAGLGIFTLFSTASRVPDSMQALVVSAGLLNLAGVVLAIAIYKWKRWGVYGYAGLLVPSMLVSLMLGTGTWSVVQPLIPMALLFGLIRGSWKLME